MYIHNNRRRYTPVWQLYPLLNDFAPFNWDWVTDADPDPFIMALDKKTAVLGEPYINPDLGNAEEVAEDRYWADVYAGSVSPGDDPFEPVSDIIYPVIDTIDRIQIFSPTSNETKQNDDTKVVSVVSASFYWRDVMKNVLPSGRGIVVVIDNPCAASFSYQIR
jgi:hypothetical protein